MQISDENGKEADRSEQLAAALNDLLEQAGEALALSEANQSLKRTMEAVCKDVADMIRNVEGAKGADPSSNLDPCTCLDRSSDADSCSDVCSCSGGDNFERIVSVSSEAVFVCQKGAIRYANPAALTLLGLSRESDLVDHLFSDFIHADYTVLEEDNFAAIVDEAEPVPMKLLRKGGDVRDVAMLAVSSLRMSECVLLAARDVTDFVSSARDLADQSKRLNNILETTVDAIVVTNSKGQIETFNRSAQIMFGYDVDEAEKLTLFDLLEKADATRYRKSILPRGAKANGAQLVGVSQEVRALHKKGRIFSAEISLSTCDLDKSRLYTAVIRDITERKQFENYLAHAASHDSLTELPNRRYLDDNLATIAAEVKGGAYAIWFVNLSGFKTVNDVMGHAAGDELLIRAGERMVSFAGSDNVIFRFSGDEFVLLLKGVRTAQQATRQARRFMSEITAPINLQGREVFLSANIGIALCPLHTGNPHEALLQAGAAMMAAREQGRGFYRFFDQEMYARSNERLYMENAIRLGLRDGQFLLYYQPQVDLVTKKTVGVEALIRWRHPERGMIQPDGFIPIAEQTGLIVRLGEWVIHQATRDLRRLKDLGFSISIAVNISPRQFIESDVLDTVRRAGEEYAIKNYSKLEVEITEGALMKNPDHAIEVLSRMKKMGLLVSLDDFGMGYSSLGYLKMFPVDKLKIDRSFIKDMQKNKKDMAISTIIVQLAHSLGVKALAEGAEEQEQIDILEQIGCDIVQGFFFSRPVPIETIVERLTAERDGAL